MCIALRKSKTSAVIPLIMMLSANGRLSRRYSQELVSNGAGVSGVITSDSTSGVAKGD